MAKKSKQSTDTTASTQSARAADRLGRGLGWFSVALGAVELVAARRITGAIGLDGKEKLVRAYGMREIASGVLTLAVGRRAGLFSRIAGDGLDMATVAPALRRDNPKRTAALVTAAVLGVVGALDVLAATGVSRRQPLHV